VLQPIPSATSENGEPPAGPLTRWFTSGTFFEHHGHNIFFRRGGQGPPVLLVHGYPTSSYDWHRLWNRICSKYHVIAPDMLGMGFSDKPERHRYSILDHADLHEAVLHLLGLERVHIIAHDLGVSVVQEMLARRLESDALPAIASVVFLNGGLFAESYRPRWIQRVLSSPLGSFVGPRIPRSSFDSTLRKLFGPESRPTDAEMAAFWELVNYKDGRRVTHRVGRFVRERALYRDRFVAPLVRGSVPIRLVNGLVDPNSGAHMVERYRELVPQGDVVELPRIGHWPQLEAPLEVFAAAAEFFDENP
jgi:pimeloyl-ACP methyl ester carboxylesterase